MNNSSEFVWRRYRFEDLGWYRCRVSKFILPSNDPTFGLECNYILRRPPSVEQYHLVPVRICFEVTKELKIDMDFGANTSCDIIAIKKEPVGKTPNRKYINYRFDIELDPGQISLNAIAMRQEDIGEEFISETYHGLVG